MKNLVSDYDATQLLGCGPHDMLRDIQVAASEWGYGDFAFEVDELTSNIDAAEEYIREQWGDADSTFRIALREVEASYHSDEPPPEVREAINNWRKSLDPSEHVVRFEIGRTLPDGTTMTAYANSSLEEVLGVWENDIGYTTENGYFIDIWQRDKEGAWVPVGKVDAPC